MQSKELIKLLTLDNGFSFDQGGSDITLDHNKGKDGFILLDYWRVYGEMMCVGVRRNSNFSRKDNRAIFQSRFHSSAGEIAGQTKIAVCTPNKKCHVVFNCSNHDQDRSNKYNANTNPLLYFTNLWLYHRCLIQLWFRSDVDDEVIDVSDVNNNIQIPVTWRPMTEKERYLYG